VAFCDLLDSVYRDLGFETYAIKLALRPEQRFGSDAEWDRAEQILRDASPLPAGPRRNLAGRNCRARAPFTRPSWNST
jgi:threonyl-tRNA synthetase